MKRINKSRDDRKWLSNINELITSANEAKKTRHTEKWPLNLHEMTFGVKRYYVHGDIVEWLKEILTPLCEEGTVSIVDIYHTPIYEDINCVEFYSGIYASDGHTILGEIFNDINNLLRYKIPWVSNATYFISIDKQFNEHIGKVIRSLKESNLWQHLESTSEMQVNWFQIRKIQILQFKQLNPSDVRQVDQIFRAACEQFKKSNALYIANPLPWHAHKYSYRPMDTLCWEICGEEWIRHGLLDEFSLSDLLAMDMANRDFRDPYFDGYMDRYLNLLISRKVPFTIDDMANRKVEYMIDSSLDRVWSVGYFMYKFRNKFSRVFVPDCYWEPERIRLKDIFNFTVESITNEKIITFRGHTPDPNSLTQFPVRFRKMHFLFENYRHFSDEMFRKLISLPKNNQRFTFNFKKRFVFMAPEDVQPIPHNDRIIEMHITNCASRNSNKMENFLRYLIKLCNNYPASTIHFVKCKFEDYTAFENIADSFTTVVFDDIKFSKNDLALFMPYFTFKTTLQFMNCKTLNDSILFEICRSKNVNIENLSVQTCACTCLIYFLLAEFYMKHRGVKTFTGEGLPKIDGYEQLRSKHYEYYETNAGGQIRLRSVENFNDVDVFSLVNGIKDDEPPFEYT